MHDLQMSPNWTRQVRNGGIAFLAAAAGAVAGAATVSAAPGAVDPHVRIEVAGLVGEAISGLGASGTLPALAGPQQASVRCLIDSSAVGPGDVLTCLRPFAAVDPTIVPRLFSAMPTAKLVATLAAARTPHDPSTPHGSTAIDTLPAPDEQESTEDVSPTKPAPVESETRPHTRPNAARYVAPTSGTITSTFGDGRGHQGIDIANDKGTPIVAVAGGTVISAGPAQGFGLWVRIRHEDGTITTYGHNNGNAVAVGQRVTAGQQIATIGNRGISTGPHLHFEVAEPDGTTVDPLPWLEERGVAIADPDDES